jgi:nitrogen fixation NifU-like protein
MDIYREELIDHYHNPRNYGAMIDANVTIELENISCGDRIQMWVKIENGLIKEISFEGEGCAVAIASASILSDYAKGKTTKELIGLKLEDFLKMLKVELTISRIKCASLSIETLKKALNSVDHS